MYLRGHSQVLLIFQLKIDNSFQWCDKYTHSEIFCSECSTERLNKFNADILKDGIVVCSYRQLHIMFSYANCFWFRWN